VFTEEGTHASSSARTKRFWRGERGPLILLYSAMGKKRISSSAREKRKECFNLAPPGNSYITLEGGGRREILTRGGGALRLFSPRKKRPPPHTEKKENPNPRKNPNPPRGKGQKKKERSWSRCPLYRGRGNSIFSIVVGKLDLYCLCSEEEGEESVKDLLP